MGIQCGIVGLPNVGKSTLFNALTQAQIEAQNYPFCTIEPNVGVVSVPDPRLDKLAEIVKPKAILPTTMEFLDIAGLVKGASKGEGLGNQFLANIRNTDAIVQVVRCFEDPDVIHVDNQVDPVQDIDTIQTELLLADLQTLEKAMARLSKQAKSGNKDDQAKLTFLNALKTHCETGHAVRQFTLESEHQQLWLKELHLLSAKPMLYIANVDEQDWENSTHFQALQTYAKAHDTPVLPLCAAIEAELVALEPQEQTEYLAELGLKEPGLNRLIRASYQLLGLETYFTAGEKEVRAWTIPIGASAPQAAGVIHSDFEKGFIRAEVMHFDDFVTHNGEQGAKAAGKWRLEGKEYIVQDGDVIHFRFNV